MSKLQFNDRLTKVFLLSLLLFRAPSEAYNDTSIVLNYSVDGNPYKIHINNRRGYGFYISFMLRKHLCKFATKQQKFLKTKSAHTECTDELCLD